MDDWSNLVVLQPNVHILTKKLSFLKKDLSKNKEKMLGKGVFWNLIKLVTVANPREQTTRVGTEKDYSTDSIPEEYLKTHIPEKVDYSLENILQDLLNFSADRLSLGGRLVYWIPIIRQAYKVS